MNNLIQHTIGISSITPTITTAVLNDIYLDLSIKGFSNNFCKLNLLIKARIYAEIVTKHVLNYGMTESEAEDKFNIKDVRHKFACNNIDLDVFFSAYNLRYFVEDDSSQIFNNNECITSTNIKYVLVTNDNYILTDEPNNILTIK